MNKPIFIDFEASSINGYPIQVAYGSCEADLKCTLIRPLERWNNETWLWDYKAQALHGFSNHFINEYGINAITVARRMSEDLKGKSIYSDSAADMSWLLMLLNGVREMTGEMYHKPEFNLISKLLYEHKVPDDIAVKAQVEADRKFRSHGLVAHKADADTLKHIWTWEAIQGFLVNK